MFDSLLAVGLGSGLGEKVATYAIKGLAVAGEFLIGYILGKIAAWCWTAGCSRTSRRTS